MDELIAESRSGSTQLWRREGKYFLSILLKSGREEATELSLVGAEQQYASLTIKRVRVPEWELQPSFRV